MRASNRDRIAEAVEKEIEWLRELRPYLESRLDRASSILVVQLSSHPSTWPVRVRIQGEKARFLVNSLSENGAVYVVDPDDWSCSCPDYHRRDQACKHVLSAYVLKRAAREAGRKGCRACVDGWVYLGEDLVDEESGEVSTVYNPVRCRRCTAVEPPYLTDDELQEWMASVRWIYAKTMPQHPREYTLKREQDPELFMRAVATIWDEGYDRSYLRRPWRSLNIGDRYYVWVWTRPERGMPVPRDTILVNRAERVQERIL